MLPQQELAAGEGVGNKQQTAHMFFHCPTVCLQSKSYPETKLEHWLGISLREILNILIKCLPDVHFLIYNGLEAGDKDMETASFTKLDMDIKSKKKIWKE